MDAWTDGRTDAAHFYISHLTPTATTGNDESERHIDKHTMLKQYAAHWIGLDWSFTALKQYLNHFEQPREVGKDTV
jgi:hypothetical protein